ncbi:MAG: hypothetical protein ACYCXG_11470, partial [Acidiferrobacter sp.]
MTTRRTAQVPAPLEARAAPSPPRGGAVVPGNGGAHPLLCSCLYNRGTASPARHDYFPQSTMIRGVLSPGWTGSQSSL